MSARQCPILGAETYSLQMTQTATCAHTVGAITTVGAGYLISDGVPLPVGLVAGQPSIEARAATRVSKDPCEEVGVANTAVRTELVLFQQLVYGGVAH